MLVESQLVVSVDLWTALEREPARRALARAVGRAVKKEPAAGTLGRLLLRHYASSVPQGQRFLASASEADRLAEPLARVPDLPADVQCDYEFCGAPCPSTDTTGPHAALTYAAMPAPVRYSCDARRRIAEWSGPRKQT